VKTVIYIDGYNLYYGLVKNTQYKWLDLQSLFSEIVKIQYPQSQVISVKYFTAPVITKFSRHKEKSQQSQNLYHRALCTSQNSCIEIINGYFDSSANLPVVHGNPIDLNNRVKTWKLEEKQTDVNIALEMYRDAALGDIKQQVLVTSDSGLIPALKYIRKDFDNINLGLILPRNLLNNRKNKKLSDCTDWTRSHINNEELEKHQFPEMIPTNKKPIYKPKYW